MMRKAKKLWYIRRGKTEGKGDRKKGERKTEKEKSYLQGMSEEDRGGDTTFVP